MRRKFWCALTGALVVGGCSGSQNKGGFADSAGGAWDTGSVVDTGVDLEDSDDPVWWRLGAVISIWESEALPDESALGLALEKEDGTTLCEESLALSLLEAQPETPDPSILVWWEAAQSDPEGSCAEWPTPVPTPLLLGIGAMHPEILARLEPEGLEAGADSLNASYISLDRGETIFVYGVAGTTAAYLGDAEPALEAPLVDGVWIIRAIYPFAI